MTVHPLLAAVFSVPFVTLWFKNPILVWMEASLGLDPFDHKDTKDTEKAA